MVALKEKFHFILFRFILFHFIIHFIYNIDEKNTFFKFPVASMI